ncbi:diffusible signal factor-reguated Ax21 faimly protein [Luteimonas sp. 100069]|uniref:diffusible signal factor-reguated Ax21 faimly protein n=1 Tax=Luteimonas sp. 100069 TaxID=2006109 RepID=UPI000F5064F7|nr:diffusible signal factor-reguated Ax21 faimly protein [Luteimonas sp. 100069]RPD85336.1 Ax21 family protein [Luteimonas sp. 100069]
MKRLSLAVLAAALPLAGHAADGLSYTYLEGGYSASKSDIAPLDRDVDSDGWSIRGSAAFHPNFHAFGDYTRESVDRSPLDRDQWRLGVGYNHEVSPRTDLLTRVAYQKLDFGHGINGDGYSVEVGARSVLLPALEGYALAGYDHLDDGFDSDFYGRLGAQWKFTPNFGVAGDVKLIKGGDTQWFIGPRLRW